MNEREREREVDVNIPAVPGQIPAVPVQMPAHYRGSKFPAIPGSTDFLEFL
jgi:hypothetical protein